MSEEKRAEVIPTELTWRETPLIPENLHFKIMDLIQPMAADVPGIGRVWFMWRFKYGEMWARRMEG